MTNPTPSPLCELCGHPMPEGEEMFKFHGYSGPCPAPPKPKPEPTPTPDVTELAELLQQCRASRDYVESERRVLATANEALRVELEARESGWIEAHEQRRRANDLQVKLDEIAELCGDGGDGTPFGRVESMLSELTARADQAERDLAAARVRIAQVEAWRSADERQFLGRIDELDNQLAAARCEVETLTRTLVDVRESLCLNVTEFDEWAGPLLEQLGFVSPNPVKRRMTDPEPPA